MISECEGPCPTQIVVFYRGDIWSLDVLDDMGELISPDHFYQAFKHIREESRYVEHSVVTLTTEERDNWTKVSPLIFHVSLQTRVCLESLSPSNARALRQVESSILCVGLTDHVGGDDNDVRK